MARIEKTVFISYRRTNMPWALAIYQNLTSRGYDVFFDYQSINSGDFEQIILGNIRARAHFLVLLTPSALERCSNPEDWLRREIETALEEKRNIVPLFFEGFDFNSPSISKYLTEKLRLLKNYNGLNVPADYFNEAMERLQTRFLSVALDAVLHPVSKEVQKAVQNQQIAASNANPIKGKELTSQEWFEKGYKHGENRDYEEAIRCYTEAIRLNPDYAVAYHNRGWSRRGKGDFDGAITDFTEAIRLQPDYASALHNRGTAFEAKDDWDNALKNYNEAVKLEPENALYHLGRANARKAKGDLDGAIRDYTETIRLKPDFADAYWGRGSTWWEKGDYYSAAADYEEYFEVGGTSDKVRQYLKDAKKKIGKA